MGTGDTSTESGVHETSFSVSQAVIPQSFDNISIPYPIVDEFLWNPYSMMYMFSFAMHKVSPTDHSYDGLDNSSQGSTALAQVQFTTFLNSSEEIYLFINEINSRITRGGT